MDMKKTFEREALTKYAMETMDCRTIERPIHTIFGSTDRKSYTVETILKWRDEQMRTLTEISPWFENVPESISKIEEKAKYKFASELYEKGKLNV